MSLLASLNTGITGLRAQGEALSIYGDNIANANTTGFKASRPEFADVVAKSLRGLLGGNQIGRGTRLTAVNPIFSQGSIIQTESATDLSITGDGFFVLDGSDGRSYTRNGSFHFDKEGALINSDGLRVMGFQADDDGRITSRLDAIKVDRTVIDAKGTEEVDLFLNLDSRADASLKFDPKRPDRTSHFATGMTVYDTAGTPHVVTLYMNKVRDGEWEWRAMAKGEDVQGGKPGELMEQANGTLKFGQDGRLEEQTVRNSRFSFLTGDRNQNIQFNFGSDKKSGGDGLQVTQYGTNSENYKTLQDGYSAGTLSGLTFNDDGTLTAVYSNGENMNLAQVAIGKFENPEGLFKLGQNRFRESRLSGQATHGAPGSSGRGTINAKTIEASTTDVASEFINLMGAQRSFQANSKVISTADQMMQEVFNIKRT
jgi:flagellar hook protein FlgE